MKEEIKLNLGCGKTIFPGFINIDCQKLPHIKYHDITQLPFKNNEVDLIYSSHTLEYFDRFEVVDVLREWYRVLKKKGTIRLAVPDWCALMDIYLDTGELKFILGPLFGRMPIRKNKNILQRTLADRTSSKQGIFTEASFRNRFSWICFFAAQESFKDKNKEYNFKKD